MIKQKTMINVKKGLGVALIGMSGLSIYAAIPSTIMEFAHVGIMAMGGYFLIKSGGRL